MADSWEYLGSVTRGSLVDAAENLNLDGDRRDQVCLAVHGLWFTVVMIALLGANKCSRGWHYHSLCYGQGQGSN